MSGELLPFSGISIFLHIRDRGGKKSQNEDSKHTAAIIRKECKTHIERLGASLALSDGAAQLIVFHNGCGAFLRGCLNAGKVVVKPSYLQDCAAEGKRLAITPDDIPSPSSSPSKPTKAPAEVLSGPSRKDSNPSSEAHGGAVKRSPGLKKPSGGYHHKDMVYLLDEEKSDEGDRSGSGEKGIRNEVATSLNVSPAETSRALAPQRPSIKLNKIPYLAEISGMEYSGNALVRNPTSSSRIVDFLDEDTNSISQSGGNTKSIDNDTESFSNDRIPNSTPLLAWAAEDELRHAVLKSAAFSCDHGKGKGKGGGKHACSSDPFLEINGDSNLIMAPSSLGSDHLGGGEVTQRLDHEKKEKAGARRGIRPSRAGEESKREELLTCSVSSPPAMRVKRAKRRNPGEEEEKKGEAKKEKKETTKKEEKEEENQTGAKKKKKGIVAQPAVKPKAGKKASVRSAITPLSRPGNSIPKNTTTIKGIYTTHRNNNNIRVAFAVREASTSSFLSDVLEQLGVCVLPEWRIGERRHRAPYPTHLIVDDVQQNDDEPNHHHHNNNNNNNNNRNALLTPEILLAKALGIPILTPRWVHDALTLAALPEVCPEVHHHPLFGVENIHKKGEKVNNGGSSLEFTNNEAPASSFAASSLAFLRKGVREEQIPIGQRQERPYYDAIFNDMMFYIEMSANDDVSVSEQNGPERSKKKHPRIEERNKFDKPLCVLGDPLLPAEALDLTTTLIHLLGGTITRNKESPHLDVIINLGDLVDTYPPSFGQNAFNLEGNDKPPPVERSTGSFNTKKERQEGAVVVGASWLIYSILCRQKADPGDFILDLDEASGAAGEMANKENENDAARFDSNGGFRENVDLSEGEKGCSPSTQDATALYLKLYPPGGRKPYMKTASIAHMACKHTVP